MNMKYQKANVEVVKFDSHFMAASHGGTDYITLHGNRWECVTVDASHKTMEGGVEYRFIFCTQVYINGNLASGQQSTAVQW